MPMIPISDLKHFMKAYMIENLKKLSLMCFEFFLFTFFVRKYVNILFYH